MAKTIESTDWMLGPDAPVLAGNAVHVWRVSLIGPATSEDGLNQDERERAAQIIAPGARNAFVATRSALRAIISRYDGVDAASLKFTTGAHGKPALVPPDHGLEFNISHSGDWAVIALSRGIPVGIDVERVSPERAHAALAERFLSPAEKAALELPDAKDGVRFFQLWARKEAYLKAIGTGLATGFSKIDATADGLPDLVSTGDPVSSVPVWFAAPFAVDDAHPACVVARSPAFSLTLYHFDGSAP